MTTPHFGRMCLVIQAAGQLDEDMGGKLDVLGVAAIAAHTDHPSAAAGVLAQRFQRLLRHHRQCPQLRYVVGGDPIPHCEVADTGADLHDFAGNLMADDARKLRRPCGLP